MYCSNTNKFKIVYKDEKNNETFYLNFNVNKNDSDISCAKEKKKNKSKTSTSNNHSENLDKVLSQHDLSVSRIENKKRNINIVLVLSKNEKNLELEDKKFKKLNLNLFLGSSEFHIYYSVFDPNENPVMKLGNEVLIDVNSIPISK